MRGHVDRYASPAGDGVYHSEQRRIAHASSLEPHEQSPLQGIATEERSHRLQVAGEEPGCRLAHRNHAFLAALAEYLDYLLLRLHVADMKTEEFRGTDPGGIEQFKHRPVPVFQGGVGRNRVEQFPDLKMSEDAAGQQLRLPHVFGDIGQSARYLAGLGEPLEPAPHHRDVAVDGGG